MTGRRDLSTNPSRGQQVAHVARVARVSADVHRQVPRGHGSRIAAYMGHAMRAGSLCTVTPVLTDLETGGWDISVRADLGVMHGDIAAATGCAVTSPMC